MGFLHAKATWESGIIPKQQAPLEAFRERGLPVIYVNSVQFVAGKDAPPEASTRDYEVNMVGVEGYPTDLVVAPIAQNYA